MAVAADSRFLELMIDRGYVSGPVLEIGSRDWQDGAGNMAPMVRGRGLSWEGCDLESGPGVDFTIDILDDEAVRLLGQTWRTVLLFNLLEHVYDPAAALRNALELVESGGSCVVCGPAVWELHQFPRDYWRPLPDFFREFAERHDYHLPDDGMAWVLNEWPYIPGRPPRVRIIPLHDLMESGRMQLPSRLTARSVWGPVRSTVSTVVQRVLNLTGRVNRFPNVGLGVVLRKPSRSVDPLR
jgi:SAM-dependent methyltransferase